MNASKALGRSGLIATMTGCRAFIENDSIQYPDYAGCKVFNREVLTFLDGHPEIKTIVLGRFWGDSDETIARTVQLIHLLVAQGRKVILIGPLPLPGMDVQIDWAMQQIRAGHAIDEIKISRSSQQWVNSVLGKLTQQLGADIENHNLFLLDPTHQLCDAESCYVVRDGQANFADTSHLTEVAAQKMEPDFRKALLWLDSHK
jgi:hypothetical protein